MLLYPAGWWSDWKGWRPAHWQWKTWVCWTIFTQKMGRDVVLHRLLSNAQFERLTPGQVVQVTVPCWIARSLWFLSFGVCGILIHYKCSAHQGHHAVVRRGWVDRQGREVAKLLKYSELGDAIIANMSSRSRMVENGSQWVTVFIFNYISWIFLFVKYFARE